MLNRFQLNNEGVWASKTVSSAQCIAWPSPTLFLLLVCQAVNIVDSHRYRLQRDWKTMERHHRHHSSAVQQTPLGLYIYLYNMLIMFKAYHVQNILILWAF